MSYLKYVRKVWKQPKKSLGDLWKTRLIEWRKSPSTVRVERPTRIDRARALGYKAKPGFVIVRQRIRRGGRQRPDIKGGRRSAHSGQRLNFRKNYQRICEERAAKKFTNCEVLNSYYLADDGIYYWYEIVLVDREHPSILADKRTRWVVGSKDRAGRGLTSAGVRGRGLRNKGRGAEKIGPSRGANQRLH